MSGEVSAFLEEPGSRDQIGFQFGTQLGTILYVPVNFTALIFGFRYVANIAGGVGTVAAQVLTQANGTITGTIDVISAQPGGAPIRDGPSDHAQARGNAGEFIVGQVLSPNTGSIMGALVYSYVPGRMSTS